MPKICSTIAPFPCCEYCSRWRKSPAQNCSFPLLWVLFKMKKISCLLLCMLPSHNFPKFCTFPLCFICFPPTTLLLHNTTDCEMCFRKWVKQNVRLRAKHRALAKPRAKLLIRSSSPPQTKPRKWKFCGVLNTIAGFPVEKQEKTHTNAELLCTPKKCYCTSSYYFFCFFRPKRPKISPLAEAHPLLVAEMTAQEKKEYVHCDCNISSSTVRTQQTLKKLLKHFLKHCTFPLQTRRCSKRSISHHGERRRRMALEP